MKPAVKYALMGGGGLVLLFGSFVTFAALSGQPMSKIAILKNFVKADEPKDSGSKTHEPETAGTHPDSGTEPREPEHPSGEKPVAKETTKAVEQTIGTLGAFALPSGFSADELGSLQQELRNNLRDAKSRLEKIESRERDLDEREKDLDQRQKELTEMRQRLLEKETDLRMLSDEVTRDTKAREARENASWKSISKFFEEGEPADMAKNLVHYDPKEAAKILHSLDDERAAAIVNALPQEKYKEYSEAYRAQSIKEGANKKP